MIIQTGMRTDIPAFYSEWFCNRLKEGYVCTRNPYHTANVTRYKLAPEVVDLIGFCTKNPAPMLPHMELLRPYGMYWFVTITPYGPEIEPGVPPKGQVMEDFKRLSGIVGIDAIGWRYDPIFVSERYTVERHIRDFETMARTLAGYTRTCVISFIDRYEKVKRNFPEIQEVRKEQRLVIGRALLEIADTYGMTVKPCGEGEELAAYGADCRGCMTIETYEKALHARLQVPKKQRVRRECACCLSGDIGQYDTCGHLCRYCYANTSAELVKKNRKNHNPGSPLLVGELKREDVIRDAEQRSWADPQLNLFDTLNTVEKRECRRDTVSIHKQSHLDNKDTYPV